MLFDNVRDAIGHTPLVRLELDAPEGVEVYAKLEMQNPFGMKDRVARNIILGAKRSGELRDGAPIVESSSGTMALGVALVGRSLGHEVHIVTDPRIDAITLAKLRALGCEVHVVGAMSSQGWQSARLERLERLMRDLPGAFWPQQYSNPDNPGAYRTLGDELLTDLGSFDVLIGSVGSGGSLCGSARHLRGALPELRVVGVDCVGSALFDQPDVPGRLQSGLGNSLMPENLDRRLIDEVHWLNDHEAFAASRALAREQQIFAGNTAGSVYRVLCAVAAESAPGTRIVGIFPDRGDRYADTVYSDEHWARHTLTDLALAEQPTRVAYGTPVSRWSRAVTDGVDLDAGHLLFVESNTTGTGVVALRTTRDLKLRPVLVTSEPSRYARLDAVECELLVCDTNDPVALRAAIQRRFRREEIVGVTTTSEFYVPVVADLADWLGLPGNPAEAVRTCRNKASLRTRLAEAGVRQPRFAAVASATEVADRVIEIGLPCVVKPADDSGSNGVLLCESVEQATEHAARLLEVRVNDRGLPTSGLVLIEEHLVGPEFSVELFSGPGGTHCVGVTAKTVTDGPYFVETRHVFPAPLPPDSAREIAETARRAVEAAGIRLGATHTEIRLTADGAAIVEVNPRLAGGMIPEVIRIATGVDLLEQQLRVATGLAPALEPVRSGYAGIQFLLADRPGVLHAVEGVDEAEQVSGVERVTVTARTRARVGSARNAYGRLGYVIAGGACPEQVEQTLATALNKIHLNIEGTA
ncbi:pyridoxal-phosphate dependent enzyme [Kitasatospora sp. NBC_01266]|uniref:pyridoxal-phosphate dependent enzyme n=1 Tax=Kitasatospora sp. NBC_01266 TaxID=2903572 RepID=UPI002E34895D|nr:pyridoxal-phosphate dependent enzyme [Kitasatospora sp. NBC_01266]